MPLRMHVFVNTTFVEVNGLESIFYFCYCIEFMFMFLAFFTVPMSIYVLFKNTVFHRNLDILYTLPVAQMYVAIIARIIIFFYQNKILGNYEIDSNNYDTPLIIASFLRSYYLNSGSGAVPACVIERYLATVFVVDYETKKRLYIPITLGGIVTIFGVLCSSAYMYNLCSIIELALIDGTMSLLGVVVFLAVFRTNGKAVRTLNTKFAFNEYSLSKKYQTLENIKSFRVITVSVVYAGVVNSILGVFILSVHLIQDGLLRNSLAVGFDLLLAGHCFVMTIVGYTACCQWAETARNTVIGLFCKPTVSLYVHPRRSLTPTRTSYSLPVRGTNGRTLYTGASQEDYFKQFSAQW